MGAAKRGARSCAGGCRASTRMRGGSVEARCSRLISPPLLCGPLCPPPRRGAEGGPPQPGHGPREDAPGDHALAQDADLEGPGGAAGKEVRRGAAAPRLASCVGAGFARRRRADLAPARASWPGQLLRYPSRAPGAGAPGGGQGGLHAREQHLCRRRRRGRVGALPGHEGRTLGAWERERRADSDAS
eukprot:6162972-Pyramimonas_sp.AAC.4